MNEKCPHRLDSEIFVNRILRCFLKNTDWWSNIELKVRRGRRPGPVSFLEFDGPNEE